MLNSNLKNIEERNVNLEFIQTEDLPAIKYEGLPMELEAELPIPELEKITILSSLLMAAHTPVSKTYKLVYESSLFHISKLYCLRPLNTAVSHIKTMLFAHPKHYYFAYQNNAV